MEALQFDAQTRMLAVINTEIPKIKNDNEILVKVAYSGICGTDLHIIQVFIYFYVILTITNNYWSSMHFWRVVAQRPYSHFERLLIFPDKLGECNVRAVHGPYVY